LTNQVRNIADVTKAVASGDLSKKITVDVKGEILQLKDTINTMVDQLSSFASEVTRVAREVGTEGKLGGQAEVKGVSGTWKDLTDNVNFMAGNLTSQVRGIAKVVTAVARGDLKQKLTVEAKGEIAELADTINSMTETLATFADQVTTVAREVGVEGKLGGQASVPGASGTWKDLTDNVNQLAGNLTTQVRAIADVATAVTKGDLTRSIKVEALGEVAALKDNINEMIRNLKETTLTNKEQDWLKTNLAKFSRMLQGQKDRTAVGNLILGELAPVVGAQQGMLYTLEHPKEESGHEGVKTRPFLKLLASYAYDEIENVEMLKLGQGLVGQCALEKQKIVLANVPDNYIKITSSLGKSQPANVLVLPVLFEGQVKGVMELASLERFSPTHQVFLDQLMESIGIVLNTIEANMRTEDLLEQSQSLAKQLQSRQEELQKTNQELEVKARLLADQNKEVERKNNEVEQARSALEEKAKQLALTSKYKSEFLANMSHELRTPLNSLLILSDQLYKNQDGNLTPKQVDFAKTIHASGNDLLALINDILDLSKIESGTVTVEPSELMLSDLNDYVDRTFRHVAENKGLNFVLELTPELTKTMYTDAKRLQQVLKNLLSNAFKFTDDGTVALRVAHATDGWSPDNENLARAREVLAFSVSDTGIGIHSDKQQIIFEAFQQADGSTSRKYGGTGLGLAISREISRMLGGEIRLISAPGKGSTFTLYLPKTYTPPKARKHTTTTTSVPIEADAGRETFIPKEKVEGSVSGARIALDDIPTVADVAIPSVFTNEVGDDRGHIHKGDRVVLIVDNDLGFAKILLDLSRESGFKGLVTSQGSVAIALARDYKPNAITLDIRLPDIDGWRVLDCLKHDLSTRHIPVYIISADDDRRRGLALGAMGFLQKPIKTREPLEHVFKVLKRYVDHPVKNLLVVEEDEALRNSIAELLGLQDVKTIGAGSGKEALALLMDRPCDCVAIGHDLPDMTGVDMIETMCANGDLSEIPMILNLRSQISEEEQHRIEKLAQKAIVRPVHSTERLLAESSMYLHQEVSKLPPTLRQMLEKLQQSNSVLAGKKVLVVDDDIRNIFAMMSVLERQKMNILSAETGKDAIELIKTTPDLDVVLMDIMMPAMDGYDTIREVRKIDKFRELPIVAVTAKAMKGDREKCIEAGATDYLAKPVDTEQLLSLLRVLLYK
jgi:signal transduction histidine kinase/DNA-binding response OmpR family regulator/HAMP domain-containing protein